MNNTNKTWDLPSVIQRNKDTDHHFFDRDTMKYFGDTQASFQVINVAGKVYVKRVRNGRNKPEGVPCQIGRLWRFDTETGSMDSIDTPAEAVAEGFMLNRYYARLAHEEKAKLACQQEAK